jgi:hypothetical protein
VKYLGASLVMVCALISPMGQAAQNTGAPSADPSQDGPKALALATAIDVQQDLALLPSGVVVSLTSNRALDAWGRFSQIAGSSTEGCGILQSSAAFCWARNGGGQVVTSAMAGLDQVVSVSGSLNSGCAARPDGAVICWDRSVRDQTLGRARDEETLVPNFDDIGPTTPRPLRFKELAGLRDIVAVTGAGDGCALHRSGAVSCWGQHWSHRHERKPLVHKSRPWLIPGLTRVRQVVYDGARACAIEQDGSVSCWGRRFVPRTTTESVQESPFDERPRRVPGVAGAVQLSMFADKECAVERTGQVICWGLNFCGLTGSPRATVVANIADAARAGVTLSGGCAVRRNGGLSCWSTCAR